MHPFGSGFPFSSAFGSPFADPFGFPNNRSSANGQNRAMDPFSMMQQQMQMMQQQHMAMMSSHFNAMQGLHHPQLASTFNQGMPIPIQDSSHGASSSSNRAKGNHSSVRVEEVSEDEPVGVVHSAHGDDEEDRTRQAELDRQFAEQQRRNQRNASQQQHQQRHQNSADQPMSIFPHDPFAGFGLSLGSSNPSSSFSYSSYSSVQHGNGRVISQSTSSRSANGVSEMHHQEFDSATGRERVATKRAAGDRARLIEIERDHRETLQNGNRLGSHQSNGRPLVTEAPQERKLDTLINLKPEEADHFDTHVQNTLGNSSLARVGALAVGTSGSHVHALSHSQPQQQQQPRMQTPALTHHQPVAATPAVSYLSEQPQHVPISRASHANKPLASSHLPPANVTSTPAPHFSSAASRAHAPSAASSTYSAHLSQPQQHLHSQPNHVQPSHVPLGSQHPGSSASASQMSSMARPQSVHEPGSAAHSRYNLRSIDSQKK